MSLRGIALYTLRAAIFAAAVCAVYALICRLRGHRIRRGRLLALAYLAALIEITVLRGGIDWARLMTGARPAPQLVPLKSILPTLRERAWWALIYHTMGNVLWFVPLGVILRKARPWQALLAGAALSAAIEFSQYLLMTGMTDIDDVLLNALGALIGWTLCRIFSGDKRGTA